MPAKVRPGASDLGGRSPGHRRNLIPEGSGLDVPSNRTADRKNLSDGGDLQENLPREFRY